MTFAEQMVVDVASMTTDVRAAGLALNSESAPQPSSFLPYGSRT